MKLLMALFALVSVGIFVPNMYADPVLSVNAGVTGGVLAETVAGDVYTWTYTDSSTNVLGQNGVLTNDDNVFTATFTYLPLGVSVLNVTDLCVNVAILGTAPNPCNLGFSFSDTAVGLGVLDPKDPITGNLDVDLGAAIGISVLDGTVSGPYLDGINLVAADIGSGSANIDFPPQPAATPEPGTLSLLGTGILGVAGLVRRKFRG